MKEMKCYDILTVCAERKNYAVAAPAFEASVGKLVKFRVDKMTMMGRVEHLMRCERFDDAWHAVATFTRIYDAVEIYSMTWSAENSDT